MPAQLLAFLAQPFSSNMSAVRWFLFIAFLMLCLFGIHQVQREWTQVEGDL